MTSLSQQQKVKFCAEGHELPDCVNLPSSNDLRPYQREFARLNLSYTVTSKRKLAQLVDDQHVSGWDDPRMPTISGMRRRGYPPQALINFVTTAGISKRENVIDVSLLEYCVREECPILCRSQ